MLRGFRGRGKAGCCCVQAQDGYCDYANNRFSTVHGRFCFAGRGGQLLREYMSLRCALGGGRSVPAKTSTPLPNTSEHDTLLLCQARDYPAVHKHDKGYCVKARDILLSQSTRQMLGQTNRHTAVIKARDTCYDKAGDALLCQTTSHITVPKHDAGAVTHTAAVKHCCSVTAQHTKP